MKPHQRFVLPLAALAALAVGCASGGNLSADQATRQIEEQERKVAELQRTLDQREKALGQSQAEVNHLSQKVGNLSATPAVSAAPPTRTAGLASGGELLPPATKAGQCFARVFVPPSYETRQIEKLSKAGSQRIEILPARYEQVEERILVSEASTKLVEVPAVYEWAEEKVLVKSAQTVWKKGRGPVEKIDDATGEIMCLVEVPAEYKTVRSRVLKTPASTRTVEVPARYKTLKVSKLIEPAREKRIEIPAEYQTVTQRELLADGKLTWRPVICETNLDANLVSSLQRALSQAGHDPGPIDGRIGPLTMTAVKSYQKKRSLPAGGLTFATIDSLGIQVGR